MLPNSAMGRPRTIQTPEEFDRLVDNYVAECKMNNVTMRVTGLTLYMGFCSVSSLHDYATRKGFEEFSSSVKRARLIVEDGYVGATLDGGGAGPIFLLKASYGYVDKQVVDVNATGEIKMVIDKEDEDA